MGFELNDLVLTIQRNLPSHLVDMLQSVRESAVQMGIQVYLVGGTVRDVLLGASVRDVDLVVEGDSISLAMEVVARAGGNLTSHSEFGVSTITVGNSHIDLAMARSEKYSSSGALPIVMPSTIIDDLRRRDFSINAMAFKISLEDGTQQAILDPFDGQIDIRQRLVRVLHDQSFVDDPTRILRAVRYEQRLGFWLENDTQELLRDAVETGVLGNVSGDRLRRELGLMFEEHMPHKAICRASELGILSAIFPALKEIAAVEIVAEREVADRRLMYLAALAYPLSKAEGEGLIARLNMPHDWATIVRDTISIKEREKCVIEKGSTPHILCELLEQIGPIPLEVVALATSSQTVRERINLYLHRLRYITPLVTGADIISMGVPEGPLIGEILAIIKRAKLDGHLLKREDEVAYIGQCVAKRGGAAN